jgi:hypothetical protein
MGIHSSRKAIEGSISVYEKLLNRVSEEEFTKTPAEGVWSYSEVFAHIFSSTIGCTKAIEACSRGTAIEDNSPLPFPIKLVLFFKRLPPGKKYKVPQVIAKDVRKISRREATELIINSRQQLETVFPLINSASATQKIKHPRLGLLNAPQWYAFIHTHLLHHQRQLGRIRKLLAGG